ncbi:MAG: hypothetical protein H6684_15195 [Deltaproteobacteria bacterium]|nr:hypothetical protein [bacterium]MCB9475665.1 hypothetical protein [Deltaproteobacteria bacterium]MCB9479186.1 hypothetical protein [Deltaproteobacteria bacterium]MCB9490077.1 hypothetical protein [Deltaproteobacteria bacterium]
MAEIYNSSVRMTRPPSTAARVVQAQADEQEKRSSAWVQGRESSKSSRALFLLLALLAYLATTFGCAALYIGAQ